MSTAIIITMGTVGIAGAMIEKVLIKLGKSEEAQYVALTSSTMLGAAAIGCILEFIKAVKELPVKQA